MLPAAPHMALEQSREERWLIGEEERRRGGGD
jgi:hypothetical protein